MFHTPRQVHTDDPFEDTVWSAGDCECLCATRDPGVGDRDVEGAEGVSGGGDRGEHRIGVGHVGAEGEGPLGAQAASSGVDTVLLQVDEHDRRAAAVQFFAHGRADAAGGTRDQGDRCAQIDTFGAGHRMMWCSGRNRRASRRKVNEKPGNIAITWPDFDLYQDWQPPVCQTVRVISRWTIAV